MVAHTRMFLSGRTISLHCSSREKKMFVQLWYKFNYLTKQSNIVSFYVYIDSIVVVIIFTGA